MEEWISAVKIELGIEASPDVNLILDVARDDGFVALEQVGELRQRQPDGLVQ